MNEIIYRPIGVIHSPFKGIEGTPIQPTGAKGVKGTIEMDPAYAVGLEDLEGFSHLIVLYHFHLSKGFNLRVLPFLDTHYRGVFATRAPNRPNPIGLSVVKLVRIKGPVLTIENVDLVDGTPLLDIKPYVPEFNAAKAVKIGWLSKKIKKTDRIKADGRFNKQE